MALDPDIGDEVRNNREAFEKTAAEWTEKYACWFLCCLRNKHTKDQLIDSPHPSDAFLHS